jgi:hypothetical protein
MRTYLLLFALIIGLGVQTLGCRPERTSEAEKLSGFLTTYVTQPITNEKILPDTVLSNDLESNLISLKGTPGEFKAATFTVNAPINTPDVTVNVSNLVGTAGAIPSSAVDIRVVKSWYQDEGRGIGGVDFSGQKVLVPELLLKDDKLVVAGQTYDAAFQELGTPSPSASLTPDLKGSLNVYENNIIAPDIDNIGGGLWKAQIFSPSINHMVNQIKLRLTKTGNPTGDVTVSIRDADINGLPSGRDLAIASIPCTSITESNWYTFNLDKAVDLKAGTKYSILIQASGSDLTDNTIWYFVSRSNPYSPGCVTVSDTSGLTWSTVEDTENYLKMTDGTYRWISNPTKVDWYTIPTPTELPVQDSDTLQPIDLSAGKNKQFWVLIKIPQTAQAGTYTGNISLLNSLGELANVQLRVEVLPFTLSPSMLEYDLFYCGESNSAYPNGTISHQYKSDQQMKAEFQDMVAHGINNVSLGIYGHEIRDWYNLGNLLAAKNAVGMKNDLYYNWLGDDNNDGGLNWRTSDPNMLEAIKQATRDIISFAGQYGVTDVYAYGLDEAYEESEVLKFKPSFQAVHEAGGKVYIAGLETRGNYSSLLGDTIDMIDNNGKPDYQAAEKWHSIGSKIFCYGNPQVGVENSDVYRRNYGILLWQNDYDGAMNFTYQGGAGAIWNDFDSANYKDHVFAYPTINGVIDTIEWEGWREGVTDIRYLTTLLDDIKIAKTQGQDTSVAETWVARLKNTDLSTADLDKFRSEVIDNILSLMKPPIVVASAAGNITTDGATLKGILGDKGSANRIVVSFEYGLTPNDYSKTVSAVPSTLTDAGPFSASITGLIPDTTYHYRVKVVGDRITYSDDKTFTTASDSWWSRLWHWLF